MLAELFSSGAQTALQWLRGLRGITDHGFAIHFVESGTCRLIADDM
jgi:hypothetical protein